MLQAFKPFRAVTLRVPLSRFRFVGPSLVRTLKSTPPPPQPTESEEDVKGERAEVDPLHHHIFIRLPDAPMYTFITSTTQNGVTTTTKNVSGVVTTETYPASPTESEVIVNELREAIEPLLKTISFTIPFEEKERLTEAGSAEEGGEKGERLTEAGVETESEQDVRAERSEVDPLGHTVTISFSSETFVIGRPGEEGKEVEKGKEQ